MLAVPADGSAYVQSHPISLTAAGPSPGASKMVAGTYLLFVNKDSVTHTVVFANGLCSLTLSPGEAAGPGNELGPDNPNCSDNFPPYVGSYAFTVDGKFQGTVQTVPLRRFVTLTARTHTIRRGTQLTLHGHVLWNPIGPSTKAPFPVIVLARYGSGLPLEPIATVGLRVGSFWRLRVRPRVQTTYIAEVNGQLPQGQVWTPAESRPFTVRMRR